MKIVALTVFLFFPSVLCAGVFEVSSSYSYQKSSYNGGSFSDSRGWTFGLGYYFTRDSEVEFSFQDTVSRDFVPNVQNIEYHDRTYSLNFNYHLLPEEADIRPYLRCGIGQLNRDATGTYQGGFSPPGRLDQVTVIGGFGIKTRLTQQIGLKAEITSYMAGGNISTWDDNIQISVGGSFYF